MGRCQARKHNVSNSLLSSRCITEEIISPYKIHCLKYENNEDGIQPGESRNVCRTCWMDIMREKQNPFLNKIIMKTPISPPNSCIVCPNPNPLYKIKFQERIDFYLKTDMYIYEDQKCCIHHLDSRNSTFKPDELLQLQGKIVLVEMTIVETTRWFSELRVAAMNREKFDMVDKIINLSNSAFKDVLGIQKDQFQDLCNLTADFRMPRNRAKCKPISLILFLLKLRHSQFLNFLKAMFDFKTKGAVSTQIKVARLALMAHFVPLHLGVGAHPRPDSLHNVHQLSKRLHFEDENNAVNAILFVDGTYVYIPKSSNYTILKRSYSQHKGRHLVKMTMLVFPNGRILDVHGPYLSDGKNNDASTLKHDLEKQISGLKTWLIPGDVLVVDRGYRDCVDFLNELGYDVEIPFSLPKGKKQHSTQEANYNRIVTKGRWIVESRNGHIKQIFKFFDRTVHAGNVPFIGEYFRIACALINAFRPVVELSANSIKVGERMEALRNTNNDFMDYLNTKDLLNNRRVLIWRNIEDEELEDFPRLTLDDVYDLTLGVYQIGQAGSYMKEKLSRDKIRQTTEEDFDDENTDGCNLNSFFQVYKEEPTVIRARMYSRHSHSTMYPVYIKYTPNENGKEGILGWYCSCKCGARTVGMCAHIAAIIWYFSYARYEPKWQQPSNDLLDIALDAAERYHHRNDE